MVKGQPGKKHEPLSEKQIKAKQDEDMAQAKHLLSKHEALSLNPRTAPSPKKWTNPRRKCRMSATQKGS
jgi:hypothetical protein